MVLSMARPGGPWVGWVVNESTPGGADDSRLHCKVATVETVSPRYVASPHGTPVGCNLEGIFRYTQWVPYYSTNMPWAIRV